MVLLALITRHAVIEKLLTHVKVPREPVATGGPLYCDVTGEPVPGWAIGLDPDPDEHGAPEDHDVVDPPAPER